MIDITSKSTTLRRAKAKARLKVSSPDTLAIVKRSEVPKGDVFSFARAAGLFAIKRTPDAIPDCHPIPIEYSELGFSIIDDELAIDIEVDVAAIYRTGVEVEAMHGAAIAALTIYDMLKPIDKGVSIGTVELLEKSGGKSQYKARSPEKVKAAVVVISDSVAAGSKEDRAGARIVERFAAIGLREVSTHVVADEPDQIVQLVGQLCDSGHDLVMCTGGTGLSPRDRTPEALGELIDTEIPGLMEAARSYGQSRTPYAALSRGVAGMRGQSLIIAAPGSSNGAGETVDALFPFVLHIFDVLEVQYRH